MQRAKDEADQHRLWTPPEPDAPSNQPGLLPWRVSTRGAYHHALRVDLEEQRKRDDTVDQLLGEHNDPPLNQEDLLGMLLSFSVTVFEVLERYDLTGRPASRRRISTPGMSSVVPRYRKPAVIEALRQQIEHVETSSGVARLRADPASAGIGGQHEGHAGDTGQQLTAGRSGRRGQQPQVARLAAPDGRRHPGLTRPDPPGSGSTRRPTGRRRSTPTPPRRSGRVMTGAPRRTGGGHAAALKLLPIAVMRALAPDVVRRRLASVRMACSSVPDHLPKRRHLIERFTALPGANPFTGRVLRMMANDVTARVAAISAGRRPRRSRPGGLAGVAAPMGELGHRTAEL